MVKAMKQIKLCFEPKHAGKMLRGGAVQLAPEHLTGKRGEPLVVMVSKPVHTRLSKAIRNGKSARITLHDLQDDIGGEGIKEWFQNLGRNIKNVYEKIKPVVAPIVKEGVGRLADIGLDMAKPFLPDVVNKFAQDNKGQAIDALGKVTGAYGIKGKKRKSRLESEQQMAEPLRMMASYPPDGSARYMPQMMMVPVPTYSTAVSPWVAGQYIPPFPGWGSYGSYEPPPPHGGSFKVL